jgi:hypothetical protein
VPNKAAKRNFKELCFPEYSPRGEYIYKNILVVAILITIFNILKRKDIYAIKKTSIYDLYKLISLTKFVASLQI